MATPLPGEYAIPEARFQTPQPQAKPNIEISITSIERISKMFAEVATERDLFRNQVSELTERLIQMEKMFSEAANH